MDEVELNDAAYIVFIDYCDAGFAGFATLEDAERYVDSLRTDRGFHGTWVHYITKVVKRTTIEHVRG